MEFESLKSAAKEITMPEEMNRRISHNCKRQFANTMEEHTVKNRKNNSFLKKPVPAVAFFTGSRCYVGGLLQLFQQAKQSHGTGGSTNQCLSCWRCKCPY